MINKYKIYDSEQRAYESLGNIMSISIISFKLYCKLFWKIPRYSYLLSYRCIYFFTQDSVVDLVKDPILNKFKVNKFNLNLYFDLLTLDHHLKI